MGLLMAPWPEPTNALQLHFPVGARGESPPQTRETETRHSFSERNKSHHIHIQPDVFHLSFSNAYSVCSVQWPALPGEDPFSSQPNGEGFLESTEEPLISALLSLSLVLSHVYMHQYLRFIMKSFLLEVIYFLGVLRL